MTQRAATAVFLVTGPSASGKSTIGALLARQFACGVHIECDVFRRWIVAGRQEMTPRPSEEALRQLELRYRVGAAAADEYFRAGFAVVLDDVIAGPMLSRVVELVESRPLHVVVLMPRLDVVRARDSARETTGYGRWAADELYQLFARETPRIGLWLDTSDQTAAETVEAILSVRGTDVYPERR